MLIKTNSILLGLFFLLYGCLSIAETQRTYNFSSPDQAKQFDALSQEIRCLVCKNQNLAESNAGLAKDLRQKIYEMIKKGQSDQQIKMYLTDRYGDFVLFNPPLKPNTYLLWLTPLLTFIIIFIALFFIIQKQKKQI